MKNEGHIQQRGHNYELSGFRHKTLLKSLPKSKKAVFGYFVRTDLRNLTSKKFSRTSWAQYGSKTSSNRSG
jgi:hypothetical protein